MQPERSTEPRARYEAVDALRGLIMMLMAVDHASGFIARQHSSEFWSGAMSAYWSAFPFLTRWITHLCAPGFFFLMGAGAYWWAAPRLGDAAAVMKRTIWRGLVLVAAAQFVEVPMLLSMMVLKAPAAMLSHAAEPMPNDGSSVSYGLITLTGLGLVLMACGLLLRLRPWAWAVAAALCVLATNTLLPGDGKMGPLWAAVLLKPGLTQHVVVMYPVIPWLGAAAAGLCFGYWWRKDAESAGRRVWLVGLAVLAVGVALRAMGGWGNIRPARDGGWIEFLNNVKYPPSAVFLAMSVGIDLLLLGLLARLPAWWKRAGSPLVVFGQTPLFFYAAHFAVLGVLAFTFFREPGSLEMAWGMWAVALVVLYPLCQWYRRFKMGKPRESAWRML